MNEEKNEMWVITTRGFDTRKAYLPKKELNKTLAKIENLRKYQLDVGKLDKKAFERALRALSRTIWGLAPMQSESSANNSYGEA